MNRETGIQRRVIALPKMEVEILMKLLRFIRMALSTKKRIIILIIRGIEILIPVMKKQGVTRNP